MNQNNNTFLSEERQPAREYKDRLSRMIFKEKGKFLELYNAPILCLPKMRIFMVLS